MKANQQLLIKFLEDRDTQFVIPVYQRHYEWKKNEQCKQLVEDIIEVAKNDKLNSHFIGSIVYVTDDFLSSELKQLTIIDGQQRLTTIILLFYAIYKKFLDLNDKHSAEQILKKYIINEFKDGEAKIKLKPTSNNQKALTHLLTGSSPNDYQGYSKIIDNYLYFYNYLNIENIQFVLKGLRKLVFVEIGLERDRDEPQKIFASLNSTGLELSEGDLIRNYILMGLKPEEQNRIFTYYWEKIEEFTKERATNKTKLSDFIRDYITLLKKEIPNKNKIYDEFKSEFKLQTINDLEEQLKELLKYSRHYSKLINPEEEPDPQIREQIEYIDKLEINVSYPFLMKIYDDYDSKVIDKKTFIEVLDVVQSYVWRRFVSNLPTNALNKIFKNLYKDIIDKSDYVHSLCLSLCDKKGTQRFPKDDEIYNELKIKDMYSIQSKNKLYLFQKLENFNNKEKVKFDENITIEHIFPQKPDRKWKEELGESDYKEFVGKYLNTIGNLTLSGNNGSLGNKTFKAKKELSDKGYQDSKLFLNKYLSTIDQWNIEEFNKRYEVIYKRFIQIWKYPKNIDIKEEANPELTIDEMENSTYSKVSYFIFKDKRYEVNTHKEILGIVISNLLEEEPDYFFNTDLETFLKINTDPSKLRAAMKVSNTHYIESSLSSKDIYKKLAKVLDRFELTDQLRIRLIKE